MIRGGEYYALTIEGDSMIEAGIMNGDTVIIKKADTARNGDIVVALVDDCEATLKQIKREGPEILLIPKNDNVNLTLPELTKKLEILADKGKVNIETNIMGKIYRP